MLYSFQYTNEKLLCNLKLLFLFSVYVTSYYKISVGLDKLLALLCACANMCPLKYKKNINSEILMQTV